MGGDGRVGKGACPALDSERTRASFDLFSFSAVSVKIKRPRALLALKAFSRKCQTEKGGPGGVESTTGACHRAGSRGHEGAYRPRHRRRQIRPALWLARHSWSSRARVLINHPAMSRTLSRHHRMTESGL